MRTRTHEHGSAGAAGHRHGRSRCFYTHTFGAMQWASVSRLLPVWVFSQTHLCVSCFGETELDRGCRLSFASVMAPLEQKANMSVNPECFAAKHDVDVASEEWRGGVAVQRDYSVCAGKWFDWDTHSVFGATTENFVKLWFAVNSLFSVQLLLECDMFWLCWGSDIILSSLRYSPCEFTQELYCSWETTPTVTEPGKDSNRCPTLLVAGCSIANSDQFVFNKFSDAFIEGVGFHNKQHCQRRQKGTGNHQIQQAVRDRTPSWVEAEVCLSSVHMPNGGKR